MAFHLPPAGQGDIQAELPVELRRRMTTPDIKMAWKNPRHFFTPPVWLKRGFSTASTVEVSGGAKAQLLRSALDCRVRRVAATHVDHGAHGTPRARLGGVVRHGRTRSTESDERECTGCRGTSQRSAAAARLPPERLGWPLLRTAHRAPNGALRTIMQLRRIRRGRRAERRQPTSCIQAINNRSTNFVPGYDVVGVGFVLGDSAVKLCALGVG